MILSLFRREALALPLATCLALAVGVLIPSLAHAQGGGGLLGQSSSSAASRRTVAPLPGKPALPPALPGARADSVVPLSRSLADMPPTEALFDAINRGDIGTVRDALSRGAQLSARNILGITPTELAIDLGRNDIVFLLLSMREADQPRVTRGRAVSAEPVRRTVSAPRPTPPPRTVSTPAARPAPVSVGGGAPAPGVGFLGFDGARGGR